MVSTFTPNIQLEEPARGDDVGVWDTPVNANMTLIDLVAGGINTISLNNSPVVLASAQYQSKGITFNSTLTASVTITFPTSFKKSYEVYHSCTGSSAFTITLQTTAAGGQAVALPPGEIIDVVNDGTNIKFKNLGRVGSYWDYAGSSVPNWVSGCSVPPYVNCDGTAFSAVTYPTLAVVLGGTTLPDTRGRTRAALNQGTARMTTANGGVDGNTNLAAGGSDSVTLTTAQMPTHSHGVTDPGHLHGNANACNNQAGQTGGGAFSGGVQVSANTNSAVTGISINNAGSGSLHTNMQPTFVGGLTLIRAG